MKWTLLFSALIFLYSPQGRTSQEEEERCREFKDHFIHIQREIFELSLKKNDPRTQLLQLQRRYDQSSPQGRERAKLNKQIIQIQKSKAYRNKNILKAYAIFKMRQACVNDESSDPISHYTPCFSLAHLPFEGGENFLILARKLEEALSPKAEDYFESPEFLSLARKACQNHGHLKLCSHLPRNLQKSRERKKVAKSLLYGQTKQGDYRPPPPSSPWLLAGSESLVRLGQWYVSSYQPVEYGLELQELYTQKDLRWIVPPSSNPWANIANQETWDAYLKYQQQRQAYFADPAFSQRALQENLFPLNPIGNVGFDFSLE